MSLDVMSLDELRKIFIGTEFFYHNDFLGVVKYITFDARLNSYFVTCYNNIKPFVISYNYMLESYKNRLKKIRMLILKNRNIQKLVHFTPISNLESILHYGILSRNLLDLCELEYSYSDDVRLDNKFDYISSSITFPNYKMLYAKRMEDLDVKWAVLSLDSDILINNFSAEFYRMNAASNDPSKCRFDPCSNEALEDMFYPENREPGLDSNYTTNPQAEVMIRDNIGVYSIKCIDTLGHDDKVKWLAYNSHIDYNSGSKLFSYRKDYERWR